MENQKQPFYKKYGNFAVNNPVIKRILGGILLFVGIVAFVTPFTPGAIWLIVVGLELLGFHFLLWFRVRDLLHHFLPKYVNKGNRAEKKED